MDEYNKSNRNDENVKYEDSETHEKVSFSFFSVTIISHVLKEGIFTRKIKWSQLQIF